MAISHVAVNVMQIVNCASHRLSSKHQLLFRLIKLFIFLAAVTSLILLSCLCQLSIMDLIICCLAFIPTGWGILLVSINVHLQFILHYFSLLLFTQVLPYLTDCTSFEAKNRILCNMGAYSDRSLCIRLWNGVSAIFYNRFTCMDACYLGHPNSGSFQQGIFAATSDPTFHCR